MKKLAELYKQKYGTPPDKIIPLRSDGSDRKIYRIFKNNQTIIGISGNNREENKAFLKFSRHFRACNLAVPEIYAENLNDGVYLEQDLGDDTLFEWTRKIRQEHGFDDTIKNMYRKTIDFLPHFQITAGKSFDYSFCYQHISFGRESMHWDLHYFKHRFLNYFYKFQIHHTKLEKDFNTLIDFLLEAKQEYFLFRDFQSRNVMIVENNPYYIDYQSGRKGALQYDLGSLLYDAKADLPEDFRDEMINYYISKVNKITTLDKDNFNKYLYGFILIRIMQAFGAYGYLSVVKEKKHFFKSVPFAIKNLEILLRKDITILEILPTLKEIFLNLTDDKSLRIYVNGE